MSDKKEKKEQKEVVDKTHWRYRKNQKITSKDATTGLKTKPFAPEKKKEEKEEEAPALEESYTEKDAKDLTRVEQEDLLKFRKVNFTAKDKEADLVKKIVSSNPKKG